MVVLKCIAKLELGMPAQLQPSDNAQAFKNFYVSIHGGLIVAIEQRNKLVDCQGVMILQNTKQPKPRLGNKMPVIFKQSFETLDLW